MVMRSSLRAVFIVLLSVGLMAGLSACGKRKPEAAVVATFEAPAKEVARLATEAAKGSSPMSDWSAGPFEVKPEGGAHLVRWTFTGEVTRAGPVEIRAFGMLESETSSSKGPRLVRCKVDKPEAAPGPATYSCDTNRFHTEDAKKMHLAPVLEKLNGFVPTRMQIEVMTVPVETTAWDWFLSMPLLGLVMLGLWWFFFRR